MDVIEKFTLVNRTVALTCSSRRTVCQLVKSHSKFTAKLLTIQELDLRFSAWRTSLPSSLELDDVLQDSSLRRSQVSLLHIIYHQVMSVLHACVIPLFCLHSIRPTDATDTPAAATEADTEMETETDPMAYESLQRASAQKALYHARQISHIISKSALNGVQLLSSGFTGYAAYSSCAIQLPFLWCRSTNVREMARRNIQVNIAIMDYIQSQWKVVAALVSQVPCSSVPSLSSSRTTQIAPSLTYVFHDREVIFLYSTSITRTCRTLWQMNPSIYS